MRFIYPQLHFFLYKPSKPESFTVEELVDKPAEVTSEVAPEVRNDALRNHVSSEDVVTTVRLSNMPPVVNFEEKATDTDTERLISQETSEPMPCLLLVSHTNGAANHANTGKVRCS
jgi:hypothetical protein